MRSRLSLISNTNSSSASVDIAACETPWLSKLISFESHGVSHAAMSTLAEDELVFEMRESRDLISRHTDRPCRHFAYPFGSDTSIGTRAAATAQLFYDSAS